jgi:uncharacterized protein (DUF1330 family)
MKYIDVTEEAGKRFFSKPQSGPIIMLNLLKYREEADYAEHPDLDPGNPISGKKAYDLYMKHTLPLLKEAGSSLIFMGRPDYFLIGPQDVKYDLMLLVKHESAVRFLEFATNPAYKAIQGHRTAALIDSRLLPVKE